MYLSVTGMPIEAAFESAADTSDDSSGQMEPPPSRGTALTFSDVTEFTLPDTSTVYTARTQNRYFHLVLFGEIWINIVVTHRYMLYII